jgi:hypothetical protein
VGWHGNHSIQTRTHRVIKGILVLSLGIHVLLRTSYFHAYRHRDGGQGAEQEREQKERAMDEAFSKFAELDDFQVIAERLRVMDTIAALTDRYRRLNEEMGRRATLAWMLP